MQIAIIGTRGIPNQYGGFEQFAEYFATYLAEKGHQITVYNTHDHSYQEKSFKGVNIVHCYNPEKKIGKIGQFLYDFNCIWDTRKKNYDIILQLGYTSSSVWHRFLPKESVIVTNMDGLEWKRTKYNKVTQKFLKRAERWAVKSSDYLIADSKGIQAYLAEKYRVNSTYIAYGAHPFTNPDANILKEYDLEPYRYNMLIARREPENNIEMILEGVVNSTKKETFLVIGDYNRNPFGKKMYDQFSKYPNIRFLGSLYHQNHLDNLRYFSHLYFHGHSVGGTNPSLLEAMASEALIIAHENIFNKTVLERNAYYFTGPDQISHLVNTIDKTSEKEKINRNFEKINQEYNWEIINGNYLSFFEKIFGL